MTDADGPAADGRELYASAVAADMTQQVSARATINLPGLPVGQVASVDPTAPYIVACLKARYLVLEPTVGGKSEESDAPTIVTDDEEA